MKIDDSFKKPGSVPFKWEIRPGVPKLHHTPLTQPGRPHPEPGSDKRHQRKHKQQPTTIHNNNYQFPETPRKLKPPPAGLFFQPPVEPPTPTRTQTRAHSIQSSPRALSERFGLARPDVVSSAGCFPSHAGKLKINAKKRGGHPGSIPEYEYYSDLEVSSRWSVSSRKSVSASPSSFPSYQSSPRPVSDAEWAGFGLF